MGITESIKDRFTLSPINHYTVNAKLTIYGVRYLQLDVTWAGDLM